jgi:hypothetical protein
MHEPHLYLQLSFEDTDILFVRRNLLIQHFAAGLKVPMALFRNSYSVSHWTLVLGVSKILTLIERMTLGDGAIF